MNLEEDKKRGVAILGSTGSIGTQALEVMAAQPNFFRVEVLTAMNNAPLLIEQARKFKPNAVVIGNEAHYEEVNQALEADYIKVFTGEDAPSQVVEMEGVDMVLAAMVGFAGLRPVMAAIEAGKTIALANKETLVVAGELITKKARQKGVNLLPVDSEHSAIFQCLMGEFHNPIRRIILTASGGPFRGKTAEELADARVEDALKHPNWDMGAKITIDSATMMNKGLEVIEAKWLFNLQPEQIEVIVHPQSIVHSLVEFQDGSMKAQLGEPDMHLPIQFALGYPKRLNKRWEDFSFTEHGTLHFYPPDLDTFRCLALALDAMARGGSAPCILNAANEVAVQAFLDREIGFMEIPEVVEACLDQQTNLAKPTLEDYLRIDRETRQLAADVCKSKVS